MEYSLYDIAREITGDKDNPLPHETRLILSKEGAAILNKSSRETDKLAENDALLYRPRLDKEYGDQTSTILRSEGRHPRTYPVSRSKPYFSGYEGNGRSKEAK